jgi:glycyl-tRNA synthetase
MSKEQKKESDLMDKIISLAKRRGFIYPSSEIYGGLANAWDFGPLGVELKNNIKQLWWRFFVHARDDMYGLDAALLMNPKTWEASGHLKGFSDALVECKNCHERFRVDMLEKDNDGNFICPSCGKKDFTEARQFNLMLKTFLGPAEDEAHVVYFRPETAQAMFVDFKQILSTMAPKLPFGVAQIGKAFRNEITPGNFIFRTREFEQMEIEYFIKPHQWEDQFEAWLEEMKKWMRLVGLDEDKISYLEVPEHERAHYSKRTVDVEFDFPFGKKELYGLAYRGDFDLSSHQKASGQNMEYFDEATQEKFLPHVIEPSLGVERTLLAVLCSAYKEEKLDKGTRVYLDFNIKLAPFKAAVFPLMANKPELVNKAKEIYSQIKSDGIIPMVFDDGGNVGKRYRRQDEIGTPYCFTVDFQTLEDDTITVRDRNTMKQERMPADSAAGFLRDKIV